jgi:hypothetical protein
MIRPVSLIILALMLLMTCSGCFFSERGGGYDDRDHQEHDDHDRGGHEEQH